MIAQLVRRSAVLLVSLVVASVLVFLLMAVLPGDPARVVLGLQASDEAVASMRAEFGLDRSLAAQYADWAGGLVRGDFGTSYVTRISVGPQVLDRLGVTAWLVGAGMVVAVLIAIPLGVLAAVRHRSADGGVASGLAHLGMATPSFLAGILLISLVAVGLGWLPSGGWTAPADDPAEFVRRLVLPALALGLVQGAVVARYVRSSLLDVMHESYLRVARSKGLGRYRALVAHGWRNAAIPVVTVLGLQLATLLIGAVVVERVFVIPGLGSLLVDAVATRDLLLVQGVVMVLVLAVLVINYAVDVAYTVLDPRLRRSA